MHRGGNQRFWVTRFPFEKYEDDCLAPKFTNIPKIIIGGAIAVDVKGPLIIFEKDKGMTNAKGNVESNSYIDHVLSRLVEFMRSELIYKSVREILASQILLGLNINRSFFRTTLLAILFTG
jgi:hypothetical protein